MDLNGNSEKRADACACYFLLMYRPEPLKITSIKLDYTWDALQTWTEEQHQGNTAFGICHIMLMHCCMQSMYTNNQMQLMLNDYHNTPHDLWSTEKQNHLATNFQKDYPLCTDEIDDEQWNLTNSVLPSRVTTQLYNHLKWSDMQLKSLEKLIPTTTNHSHSLHHNKSCTNPSHLSLPLQAKQVQLCFCEI